MRQNTPHNRAFTLVELLAVIAIIALLIGILVPTVGAARNAAKKTASANTLAVIGTGLETFKADARLGGAYPPSRSDIDDSGWNQLEVYNPYTTAANDRLEISGAGLLVWGLAGADLLGTPGFKVVNTSDTTRNTWAEWSGQNYDDTNNNPVGFSDLYALYEDGDRREQPVHPRSGPYVALDKMVLTERKPGDNKWTFDNDPTERDYPMFLDSFGNPILYWRADVAGKQLIDRDNVNSDLGSGVNRGIYHWADNAPLVSDVGSSQEPLKTDNADGTKHRLGWENPTNYSAANNNLPNPGTFAAYIRDGRATGKLVPFRDKEYLLVSPGQDGIYGTGDDIANFEFNGN